MLHGEMFDKLNTTAIDAAPVGILIVNRGQRIIHINRQAEKTLGHVAGTFHTLEELWSLVAPDPQLHERIEREWRTETARLLDNADPFGPLHYPLTCADGRIRHVEFRLGVTDGLQLVVMTDVTAREQAHAKHLRSRRILELFIEHAPAAIAMFDTEMRYIAVSRRYLSDYGIEDREVIGRSHYAVFPEIPERWREIHRRCLQGATERCEEDAFPRPGGKTDWIRWELRPWYDQEGTIGGLMLSSEVITEQKQSAEALAKSEEKFRKLFHKHVAVKLIVDPDSGEIVEANDAAAQFYGWSKSELQGMQMQDISTYSPEQVESALETIKNGLRAQFESRHRLADGSMRDVAVYSNRIDIDGKPLLHSIVHDITEHKRSLAERKKLYNQLLQAQKMETVGQLAGGIAHDYNNMLSVIIGYTEIAMERVADDASLQTDLKEILRAARRSVDITQQLLAFARKQTINPRSLDLNETVKGMLKMLGRLIGEGIELNWRPGEGVWPVKIDPLQVDQILANLCVNARDAIDGVGRLTIETGNTSFDETYCQDHLYLAPGDYTLLTVSDNGCGMDHHTAEHIFEPFFTTKGLGKGTGLGLSTVYGIIKQNDGFINVYSEQGNGTTVRIYLPRHGSAAESPQAERVGPPPKSRGETVLLVEDEHAIRSMSGRMLEALDYTVLGAATPGEALALATRHESIHLLITDVVMPEMNGRQLADRLQRLHPDMKVLFMSGYTAEVIVHHGILDHGVNFLAKPFSRQELASKVRSALGR